MIASQSHVPLLTCHPNCFRWTLLLLSSYPELYSPDQSPAFPNSPLPMACYNVATSKSMQHGCACYWLCFKWGEGHTNHPDSSHYSTHPLELLQTPNAVSLIHIYIYVIKEWGPKIMRAYYCTMHICLMLQSTTGDVPTIGLAIRESILQPIKWEFQLEKGKSHIFSFLL